MNKAVQRFSRAGIAWVGFGWPLIGLLMLITAGIGAFGTVSLYNSEADVQHSNAVFVGLERLLALARDAETGQRGFVITGRDEYLQPYREAEPEIVTELDTLQSLLSSDPQQVQRLERLRTLLDEKHRELRTVIDVRRSEGFDAAQAIVGNDTGKMFMDRARTIVRARCSWIARGRSSAIWSKQSPRNWPRGRR